MQLKGFTKTSLQSGESATVEFVLKPRDLSVWKNDGWELVNGATMISIGSSSRDIRLWTKL